MSELSACPFCGGEARMMNDEQKLYLKHWVQCSRCRASTDRYRSEEAAAEAWNQRALAEEREEG